MSSNAVSPVVEYLEEHGPADWAEIHRDLDVTEDELETAIDDLLDDDQLTFSGGGYNLRD